jgi:hypothetical protein
MAGYQKPTDAPVALVENQKTTGSGLGQAGPEFDLQRLTSPAIRTSPNDLNLNVRIGSTQMICAFTPKTEA